MRLTKDEFNEPEIAVTRNSVRVRCIAGLTTRLIYQVKSRKDSLLKLCSKLGVTLCRVIAARARTL